MKLPRHIAPFVAAFLLAVGLAACDASHTAETSDEAGDSEPSVSERPEVHPEIWPEVENPPDLDPEVEAEIGEMIAAMSVTEKVGQIIQAEIRHTTPEDAGRYHLGSVLNGGGSHPGGDRDAAPADWLELADAYWDASTAAAASSDTGDREADGGVSIPLLWGVDAVHGHNNVIGATLFPHNVALGATRDAALVEEIGEATAKEIVVTGLDWNFSPTVAVARDLRWGRAYESYSQDPDLVAELGAAYVRGVQGDISGGQGSGGQGSGGHGSGGRDGGEGDDAFLGPGRVISTAKHFLGDGGTTRGIDQGDAEVSEETLRDVHGAGYVTTLEAGVQAVMASFSSWHGKKLHGHHGLLTEVLKERMGFHGFVVGDWNGHGQVATCSNESCAPAFLAGVDMFMVPEDWKALYEHTRAQVESGEIPMERLDGAVRRILRVKHRYGLFDPERRGVRPSERPFAGEFDLLGSEAHRELARRAVRQSLVLLKNESLLENESDSLPIAPGAKVLVTGDGAHDVGKQSGGWTISWQGTGNTNDDFPGATSIWQGLEQAITATGGTAILSEDGSYDSSGGKPDVAVLVFGEDPYAEFQGDRLTVQYSPRDDSDLRLLRELREDGIATVSVFLTGRPLWVNPHLNASDAFVVAWLPGSEGGGVADVLVAGGDGAPRHDFTGRLPFAWPRSVLDARPAEMDDPLFALGFGLSYGDDGSLPELSEEVAEDARLTDGHNYFRGGPVAPWRIETTGDVAVEAVDREVQEDARRIAWSGAGSVALSAEETVDLRREANGGLSLAFDVLVEAIPDAVGVELAMVGTVGEAGAVPLGDVLRRHADGEWHRLRVSLRCFAEAGADLARLHTPWRLSAGAGVKLRVAEISLDTAGDGEALCPSAEGPAAKAGPDAEADGEGDD